MGGVDPLLSFKFVWPKAGNAQVAAVRGRLAERLMSYPLLLPFRIGPGTGGVRQLPPFSRPSADGRNGE
jgi:hypothetical protein